MLKKEKNGGFDGSSNSWARVCDNCHSATCTVYCRADSAYLCAGCDARIHAAPLMAFRHERVWVCEACERAPAAFLCKADAASLCASCDADIHSANPLARRHHRVPIMPIPGIGASTGEGTEDDGFLSLTGDADDTTIDEEDEDEAASWLLLNPPVKNNNKNNVNNNNNQNNNYGMLFGGEVVDDYLDLAEYGGDSQFNDQYSVNQQQQHYSVPQKSYGGDSIVPVQDGQRKSLILYHQQQQQQQSHHLNFQLGMEYDNSNTGYGYPASLSHSKIVLHEHVYCRADSTYLCSGCDARMHAASLVASHHKRVWICEACKHAPAAFFCKADVASLCASCDADIHSANLLAHRHHRVPIIPIPGSHHSFHREHINSSVMDLPSTNSDTGCDLWVLSDCI